MNATLALLPTHDAAPHAAQAGPRPLGRPQLDFALDAVLHAYSQVLFARSRPLGAALLAASFVVPAVGLIGLFGVLLAAGVATLLQLDRQAVRSGVLGYNALLVFLAIGAMLDRSPAFWLLALITALLVVLCHVALGTLLAYHLRLPVLSVPFVFTTWTVMAAAPHLRGVAFHGHPPALDLGPFPGPALVDDLLRALGAIFFQPHWTAGLLVLLALLAYSRIATVHALLGFAVAVFADRYLFAFPAGFLHLYIGFNFIVTAIALGGIYYVPSAASLLLAGAGALGVGLISVSLLTLLSPVGLPVLAAPFNLVTLTVLYALGQRTRDASPHPVDLLSGPPEAHLAWYRTRVRRFASPLPVRLQLPFRGAWTCTQGNDGAHTHQGPWRHGLDFEVTDPDGRTHRGAGAQPSDFYCYRLPVLAPAAGTVVRVIDGVPDNPIGEVNTQDNWGNLVLMQHGPELFTMLAHLSPGTIAVREGQVLAAGEPVGLCGSSGRSPVPHLHVQLQASPVLGDPTLPIHFVSVALLHDEHSEALAHHLPTEGQRVRSLARVPDLAATLTLPPGRTYRFELTEAGARSTVTLRSELDALGHRSLHDPSTGARLWFDDRGEHFVVYDHEGPRRGALLVLYCALARVPLDEAPDLRWTDLLAPDRHSWSVRSWLTDALAAFVAPADQRMRYHLRSRAGGWVITGASEPLAGAPALRTEAVLHPTLGLTEASAQIGARTLHLRRLDERP